MKIILVSCVAPPETIVAGHVFWDIAIDQHNRGNEVLIITPKPSRPLGKFKFVNNFDKITDFGFRHICINSFVYPKNNILGRSMESFSFGFNAAFFIKKRKIQADLIYALTWPFLGQSIFLKILGNRYKVITSLSKLTHQLLAMLYASTEDDGFNWPTKDLMNLLMPRMNYISNDLDALRCNIFCLPLSSPLRNASHVNLFSNIDF
jgi:hypothetical protein